jgi:16S rRNA (guanine(966)-N(2))-methyltransferase RsmD
LRIIEGKYRRRPLQSTSSPRVRPTARRLREALFDFLGARIAGARFLDLCAGSGAIGIEALSRGASYVTFVDRSAKICGLIEANLNRCEILPDQREVVTGDAIGFLRSTMRSAPLMWDIVFFDPPYAADYAPVLTFIGTGATLKRKKGVLVVEHHCEKPLRDEVGSLRRWRVIRQGQSCLSFYEQK